MRAVTGATMMNEVLTELWMTTGLTHRPIPRDVLNVSLTVPGSRAGYGFRESRDNLLKRAKSGRVAQARA